MKHRHLITGLLICSVMSGCGDYGDDGAVNSTGNPDAEPGATDFTLAVAVPTFGPGGTGSKLRLRADAPIARAVTGSAAFTELARDNVRAFVIIPDNGNASGFREVSIDVVEFENLGTGRYRIAIDGQAQVDGFFAVEINGVIFKVPLLRTGTTDQPIDVNALQSALADRLQALLVADEVCDTLAVADLDAIFARGQTYMATLQVPDDINDLEALVGYYRVAATSFMQSEITRACAPPLNSLATAGLPGSYHALRSGANAAVDGISTEAVTSIAGFTTLLSIARSIPQDTARQFAITQSVSVERDDRYLVAHAAGTGGVSAVLSDLSSPFPEVGTEESGASMIAFANDASRALLQFDAAVEIEPSYGSRSFAPGFTVAGTPAWQLLPQNGSLFGASQTTTSYIDLSQASASCLGSLGLASAQLVNAETFGPAARAALEAVGAEEFASRLQLNCGGLTAFDFSTNLHVETRAIDAATPLALADLAGRYALVGLQWSQRLAGTAAAAGYGGSSADTLFDISATGGMTVVAQSQSKTFQPTSALLGGIGSTAPGDDGFSLQLPLDQSQNTVTDGHVQVSAPRGDGSTELFSGFVSVAPHNLLALSKSSLSSGGGAVGGYTLVDSLPDVLGGSLAVHDSLALVYGYESVEAVDISNPRNLQWISSVPSLGSALDIAIDGNGHYAYVAAGSDGLQVVDISNPAAMTIVGAGLGDPFIAYAEHVKLVTDAQGNAVLALVGDSDSGGIIRAINVSTPGAPELLGSYSMGSDYPNALAVAGNALLVGTYSQLLILDFSQFLDTDGQSNSFSLIASPVTDDTGAFSILVDGSTAYLGASTGLYIVNIGDIANISLVGMLELGDNISSISVLDDRAYLTLTNEGFAGTGVVDISTPSAPQLIATLPTDGDNVAMEGYVLASSSDSRAGLTAVQTDNAGPQKVAGIAGLNADPFVRIVGTTAYQANVGDGFSAYDISNPASPVLLDTLDVAALGGTPNRVALLGNYAYVTTSVPSLVIVNIADTSNLTIVGTPFTLRGYPSAVAAFVQGTNQYVAVAAGNNIDLVNVTTPSAPTLAQSIAMNDTLYDVAVSGDGSTAYVGSYNALSVIDLTFIGNAVATPVGNFNNVRGVKLDGSYLYAASFSSGLQVINPGDFSVVGSFYDLQTPYSLEVDSGRAFMRGEFGISIIDVSNPAALTEQGFLGLPGFSNLFAVSGQYVFASSYDSSQETAAYGIDIYRMSTIQDATSGLAVGVRLSSTPLTEAALAGQRFTLAGQQLAQVNDPSTSRRAAFTALAGASLRFVSVAADVYPVFDLPLNGMVISDFSGVLPKLEIRFAQWQSGPVDVDANGRWTFTLTSGDDSASFAGYVGNDGTLVGHGVLFDVAQPAVVEGDSTAYPALNEASQLLVIGVPHQQPELPAAQ